MVVVVEDAADAGGGGPGGPPGGPGGIVDGLGEVDVAGVELVTALDDDRLEDLKFEFIHCKIKVNIANKHLDLLVVLGFAFCLTL